MNYEKAGIKSHKEIIKQTPAESREMVDLLNLLMRKLRLAGANFGDVGRVFEQAYSISKKIDYPDGEAIALSFWGIMNISLQRKTDGLKLFKESLKLAPAIAPKTLCRIYCDYGFFLQNFGEFDKSFEYIEKSLTIAFTLKDEGLQSYAYLSLGRLGYFLGEIDDSIIFAQKALAFQDHKPSLAQILDFLGYCYYLKGEYSRAIDCFNNALAERLDYDIQTLINLKSNLALALQKAGRTKEAEENIKSAMEILKDTGNLMNWAFFMTDAAEFYFDVGNFEKSLDCREQVSQGALRDENWDLYFLSEIGIAECLFEMDDRFQTEEQINILLSKLEGHSEKDLPNINSHIHKCYSALAKLYIKMNIPEEARKYLSEAQRYKDLTALAELNRKPKMLAAKIRIEEFKKIAFA